MSRQKMLADLARSGLTPADAKRMGARTQSWKQTEAQLAPGQKGRDSYAIPYFDLDGKRTGFARYRNLEGTDPKYLQKRGTGVEVYLPPSAGNWKKIAADTSEDLLITEGEKKAYAGSKHVPTIGLGGVDSFSRDGALHPTLQAFAWAGRIVYLVFDSDLIGNFNVRRALLRLGNVLRREGALVLDASLHHLYATKRMGLDDAIVEQGPEVILELTTQAEEMLAEDVVLEVNDRYVLVGASAEIFDTDPNRWRLYSKSQFETNVSNLATTVERANGNTVQVPASRSFFALRPPYRNDVDRLAFRPEEGLYFRDEHGARCLNTWRPPTTIPVKGDASPVLELIDAMLGDTSDADTARHYLLNTFATLVQHPGQKHHTATLFYSSASGTGKSTLGEMMAEVLAPSSGIHKAAELHSGWTHYLVGRTFIVFDELFKGGKIADTLKALITAPMLDINTKYVANYQVENYTYFWMTSNHPDVLSIQSDSERRYFVYESQCEWSQEKFERVWHWFRHEGGRAAWMHYLLTYPIAKDYNSHFSAPKTQHFHEMRESSRSPVEVYAMAMQDNVALSHPFRLSELSLPPNVHMSNLGAQLRARKLGVSRKVKFPNLSHPAMLWMVRDLDRWYAASNAEWREAYYEGQGRSAPGKIS